MNVEWTCFSCGTEYETTAAEPEVPRCPICRETLCSKCYERHMKDHNDDTPAAKLGAFVLVMLLVVVIALGFIR